VTTYLLDTSVVVDFIRGKRPEIERGFREAERTGHIVVSSVVEYELCYGAERKADPQREYAAIQRFLDGPVIRLAYDAAAAWETARTRRELERTGRPIGHYDLLIAGQARRNGWTVVTSNRDEFGRVLGLSWEAWRG
jgi:tRNA(fMet)-specific endonuclease VapC